MKLVLCLSTINSNDRDDFMDEFRFFSVSRSVRKITDRFSAERHLLPTRITFIGALKALSFDDTEGESASSWELIPEPLHPLFDQNGIPADPTRSCYYMLSLQSLSAWRNVLVQILESIGKHDLQRYSLAQNKSGTVQP
jgi:hypothetical protein